MYSTRQKIGFQTTATENCQNVTKSRNYQDNKFLHVMRVAFLELMLKEAAGYRSELADFNKKLEAARILFPEDLRRLKEDLDTI